MGAVLVDEPRLVIAAGATTTSVLLRSTVGGTHNELAPRRRLRVTIG
jgi:hypothetical protein